MRQPTEAVGSVGRVPASTAPRRIFDNKFAGALRALGSRTCVGLGACLWTDCPFVSESVTFSERPELPQMSLGNRNSCFSDV